MRKNYEDYDNGFYLNKDWIFPYSEIPVGASVLLYGAGDVGQAYYEQIKRTEYCTISQWVDRCAEMYREWGLPVVDIDSLNLDVDYAVIAVASSCLAREINRYLVDKGIPQEKMVWNGNERLYLANSVKQSRLSNPIRVRLKEVLRRQGIDPNEDNATQYIEGIAERAAFDEELIIPRIVVEITAACTLRCKKCNNLMPMYKTPSPVPIENVIADIEILLKSVDQIITLELIGGEPFTYGHLPELLDYVLKQDKVMEVELTTNGTIVPKNEVLERLANRKVTIRVSQYPGVGSDKVIKCFLEHGIRYETWKEMQWIDSGNTEKRNRNKERAKAVYIGCDAGIYCKTLYRGRLYACARAASLYDLGICTVPGGFLDIRESNELRKDICDFFLKQTDPSCDYCDYADKWRVIPAGVQAGKGFRRELRS